MRPSRRPAAEFRRTRVAALSLRYCFGRGVKARIARELGVSEATVSRDCATLMKRWRASRSECPFDRQRTVRRASDSHGASSLAEDRLAADNA